MGVVAGVVKFLLLIPFSLLFPLCFQQGACAGFGVMMIQRPSFLPLKARLYEATHPKMYLESPKKKVRWSKSRHGLTREETAARRQPPSRQLFETGDEFNLSNVLQPNIVLRRLLPVILALPEQY